MRVIDRTIVTTSITKALILAGVAVLGIADASDKEDLVYAEVSGPIPAAIEDVWAAFTTADGLSKFYARKAVIELRVGGLFEMHVFPDNPPGQRGIEGLQVLAVEPQRRLMTTWISPKFIRDKVNDQTTIHEITLMPRGPKETIVRFRQFGFGEGPAWDKAKWYFELRQRDVYLSLKERFESEYGTVNWDTAMKRFWVTTEIVNKGLESS